MDATDRVELLCRQALAESQPYLPVYQQRMPKELFDKIDDRVRDECALGETSTVSKTTIPERIQAEYIDLDKIKMMLLWHNRQDQFPLGMMRHAGLDHGVQRFGGELKLLTVVEQRLDLA
jgi:hypothetical protein